MYKFIITFFAALCLASSLYSQPNPSTLIKCSPEFKQHFDAIQQIPEAKSLINNILKEGPVHIIADNTHVSDAFGAHWDPIHRVITIAKNSKMSKGAIIGSLLFELHNAAVDSKFYQLDKLAMERKISRSRYIESMEYLEYLNSHNAAKIAEIGIRMGLLPKDSRLPTYPSFKEHYYMQQISGHSNCFSQNYDMLQNM